MFTRARETLQLLFPLVRTCGERSLDTEENHELVRVWSLVEGALPRKAKDGDLLANLRKAIWNQDFLQGGQRERANQVLDEMQSLLLLFEVDRHDPRV
jgi:hypothetical protein